MAQIAPTAYVDPKADIADDVIIGPCCYVGAGVTLGPGCELMNNVTIRGRTTIGPENVFFPNAVLGTIPQDLKYAGGETLLEVGRGNICRENVTVHLGTEIAGGKTVIGNHNLLMVGAHVAHDACLEDHILLANNVLLAGHVHIESNVTVGGGAAMHHFTTIGQHSFIGGLTRIVHDVPPFTKFSGDPGKVRGLNAENLIRCDFDEERIAALREAYKSLYASRGANLADAIRALEGNGQHTPEVAYLIEFVKRTQASPKGRFRETLRGDSRQDVRWFYENNQASGPQS